MSPGAREGGEPALAGGLALAGGEGGVATEEPELLRLAADFPGRVAALVLVATAAGETIERMGRHAPEGG